jgi:hypothetical protein
MIVRSSINAVHPTNWGYWLFLDMEQQVTIASETTKQLLLSVEIYRVLSHKWKAN